MPHVAVRACGPPLLSSPADWLRCAALPVTNTECPLNVQLSDSCFSTTPKSYWCQQIDSDAEHGLGKMVPRLSNSTSSWAVCGRPCNWTAPQHSRISALKRMDPLLHTLPSWLSDHCHPRCLTTAPWLSESFYHQIWLGEQRSLVTCAKASSLTLLTCSCQPAELIV